MSSGIIAFFNEISSEYDDLITRTVPRYGEMFWAMLYYLPDSFEPEWIVELGCGTGNLTALLARRWPKSTITVVDVSTEMLQKTTEKLSAHSLIPVESYFEEVSFEPGQFDLVISSIAMHHVPDPQKEPLIRRIGEWLAPGGFFVLGDQVRGANQRLYQADVTYYEAYAREHGALEDDILAWREHRESVDHYATVAELMAWMRAAGLVDVDLLWRYCFWAVLQGQKPKA